MRTTIVKRAATLALAGTMAVCGLALAGCQDKPAETPAPAPAAQEQDNCYGDDLPAINTGADEQDNCYGDDLPAINTQA